jgi:hypothetical protein
VLAILLIVGGVGRGELEVEIVRDSEIDEVVLDSVVSV